MFIAVLNRPDGIETRSDGDNCSDSLSLKACMMFRQVAGVVVGKKKKRALIELFKDCTHL